MTVFKKIGERGVMTIYRLIREEVEAPEVGDQVEITINGETYTATVIKKNTDKAICLLDECICRMAMNEEGTTEGGYLASEVRKYLHKLEKTIPDCEKLVLDENGDRLHLLSLADVFGYDDDFNSVTEPIPWMKDRSHRVAHMHGDESDSAYWWLRDPVSASHFALVGSYGLAGYSHAADTWFGVRPAFGIC